MLRRRLATVRQRKRDMAGRRGVRLVASPMLMVLLVYHMPLTKLLTKSLSFLVLCERADIAAMRFSTDHVMEVRAALETEHCVKLNGRGDYV